MKPILMILAILITLTACAPKIITLDDARQIAVNRIMTDDNYVQYDGYDFVELDAKTIDCEGCYLFRYEYKVDPRYADFDGYIVDVVMKDDQITSVIFDEQKSDPVLDNPMPPIAGRFDKFCENKCGDGYCDDVVCQEVDCTCEETPANCPEDC